MDFDDFEDELITQLKTAFPDTALEVRSYPDNPDNYISQLKHIGGAILVSFQGGSWETPEGNNQRVLVQEATYLWQFTTLKKSLARQKNQSGSYDTLELIRTTLSGFTPAGFDDSSVLFPVNVGFIERVKGFYSYQITMGHTIEESEA